ncbi:adenosine deaminase-like protein isoform X2 [Durio zibethinus]|uniref:Adenosine deaminase-like protein isoform X2 n=1 Tax=Durio zibethinus TaxID=66656 RepID=A0A6P5WJF8_DURZI|nr:adenosine deaminase-like protein isoform X2 [Durio zibethinus]
MNRQDMEWCVSMPKVELHAHLNGSVRNSTLLELARVLGERGIIVFSEVENVIMKDDRTLHEVFKLFDLIHILTTDHSTVTRITTEVIEDFASENVVYLELRTTPKRNDSIGMSKRSYMEAVMEGLKAVSSVDVDYAPTGLKTNTFNGTTRKKIYVRFLLSIDRRESTEAAMETVKLALEMRDLGVIGIDLSGNPIVGNWATFLPALKYAREQGLYLTLHCGEVEICLTSNIRTETISSIDIHHFVDLYKAKHPLILCTDDSGVFSTCLSGEYCLASSAFGLGKTEMFQLAENAIDFIFADDGVKEDLRATFEVAAEKLDL